MSGKDGPALHPGREERGGQRGDVYEEEKKECEERRA